MSNVRPLRSRLPARHQARFITLAKDLQEVVRHCVPTDLGRYQTATVLGFDWSNDTTGVQSLREEVSGLLRRVYVFQTERVCLTRTTRRKPSRPTFETN
jgi:hypothetical protein